VDLDKKVASNANCGVFYMSAKKKLLSIFTMTMLAIFTPLESLGKQIGYSDVDWGTCGPNGVANRARLMWDAKSFWVWQYIGLERILETNQEYVGGNIARYCSSTTRNSTDRATCILEWQNRFSNYRRCLGHAKKMCQIHGGAC